MPINEGFQTGTVSSAKERYTQLERYRKPFLDRARECALLTIPSLLPPEGHTKDSRINDPYQAVGSEGVKSLSSKLILTLLPPNRPFFRVKPKGINFDDYEEGFRTEIEKALSRYEQTVQDDIEASNDRPVLHEMLKYLIVTGNALLVDSKDKGMKVYNLNRYVVKRDPMGEPIEIVVKETIDYRLLPDNVQATVNQEDLNSDKTVNIYTHLLRDEKQWTVYQEANEQRIPGTDGTYPLDAPAFIALRFTRIDGEDYGRGYVEDILGDLKSLEGLSKSLVDGAIGSARGLIFVNPNGSTSMKRVSEAPNWGVVSGNADDVSVLQAQKSADLSVAERRALVIEDRLAAAFLLNSSIQRQAERVTAEEIRLMANELDSSLGGFRSVITVEWGVPYAKRKINKLTKKGLLPALPKGLVEISIVTGIEALGRGQDLQKLDLFWSGTIQSLGPEIAQQYLNASNYMDRRAAALGLDTDGLVRSEEEVQQAQQQAMQMQMMQQVSPEIIKQVGGNLNAGQQG